jgi:hypothetical protein
MPNPTDLSAAVDGQETCWVLSTVNGLILDIGSGIPSLFNLSARGLLGRDIYLFIGADRDAMRHAAQVVASNVSIERSILLRPRDRRPLIVQARVSRTTTDATLTWTLTASRSAETRAAHYELQRRTAELSAEHASLTAKRTGKVERHRHNARLRQHKSELAAHSKRLKSEN